MAGSGGLVARGTQENRERRRTEVTTDSGRNSGGLGSFLRFANAREMVRVVLDECQGGVR